MQRFSKQTYGEQVAQLIRQRIRNGKLRGGDSVGEAGLAEECGISRAPVREALYQLETEGLLMSHPKRGRCVTVLTPEGIRNSYELSGLLEGAAAAKAARNLPSEIRDRLAAIIDQMREAVRTGEAFDEHATLGTEFHETILSLSDNPLLRFLASRSSRVISKFLPRNFMTGIAVFMRPCAEEIRRLSKIPCAPTMRNLPSVLPDIAKSLPPRPEKRGRRIFRRNNSSRT